ncbi:MAG: flagellin [Pirellulaceae bacterium]|nr:flagellin [Pirellulaceae bacterium]
MASSFYPVVSSRVSDGLVRNRSLFQVQSDQAQLLKLQTQLSTGHKFQTPSEAPTAAVRVMGLQRAQELKQQSLVNLKSAQGYLNITETSLSNVQDILDAVKGLTVEASTNLLSDTDRKGLETQIDAYLDRLLALGNQRSQDRYLFTGGEVTKSPLERVNSVARFQGDDLDLLSIADQNNHLMHNVTSQKAFGVISTGVTGSTDLNPSVTEGLRLADLNGGQGVRPGAIQVSDGVNSVIIDLASSETVGDILEKINGVTLSGRALEIRVDTFGLSVNYLDAQPGTLRISDSGSGRISKDLGIATTVAQPVLPILGGDLNPILRKTTLLSQLNNDTGLDVTGGIRINQNGKSFNIDFSTATNVEDLLTAINNSGASVIADIAPGSRSLRIRSNESGSDFSISENSGTLAARLGLRTFNGNVPLSSLNHGQGIELADGPDLTFTRSDGTDFSVDIQSAITVQDVINLVNNHPDNQDPALRIVLGEQPFSNGLTLSAAVPPTPIPPLLPPVPIGVRSSGGSSAAIGLGLVPKGTTSSSGTIVGTNYVIDGWDPNPQETEGMFNSLLRLKNAVRTGNLEEIARSSTLLDTDIERLTLARSDLGIRQQRIDSLQTANEDSLLEFKSQESDIRDVDIAGVISELTSRQAAYEANLRLLSQNIRQTIFDFI